METTRSSIDPSRVATRALAVVMIAGWLALATWAAGVLLMIASLSVATFFGEPPSGGYWVEGVAFSLAGVIVAAAGPLGVWLVHRRRGWLIAAGYAAVITLIAATCLLVAFGTG